MPDQSSNATALRGVHRGRLFVSVMTGDVVMMSAVSATPDYPALNLSHTVQSGSASNVKPGMRVVIETETGGHKGTLSVRFAGTINSTNLPVREFSKGSVQVVSGDVIKVYDDFLVVDLLVADDETFAPDHEAYSDQNSNPAPIVCSGGYWAGWLTMTPVAFKGDASYAVDPDSGGTLTHAWGTSGGSLSSTSTANPTLTLAAAGKYLVTHTVTDNDNSKAESQYIRVRAHTNADPPYTVTLNSIDGDPDSGLGFHANVTFYGDVSLADIPDGAPVILWTDEFIANTRQSFGHKVTGRSHILLFGYVRRDTQRIAADEIAGAVTFDIISPLARLAELPGFSKVMLREQSPDAWNEIKTLKVFRAILQLARYYTNVLQICDLIQDGFSDADYSGLYLQKTNPYEQMKELAASRGGRVICDRVGRLEVQGRLELSDLDDRAAITTTFTFNWNDVISAIPSREHYRPVETVRASGFTPGTSTASNQPVFARCPESPGFGNTEEKHERFIATTDQLFAWTALLAAWGNRDYFDADGLLSHAFDLELVLLGGYSRIVQFYREWFEFAPGSLNAERADLGNYRYLVTSVSEDWTGGIGRTTLKLRAETHAPADAAVDDTPPSTPQPPIVVIPPQRPPVNPIWVSRGTNYIAYIADDGYLYRTAIHRAASPIWEREQLVAEGIEDFVVDAYCDNYYPTPNPAGAVDGDIATFTKWIRLEDVFGTPALTDLHTFNAATNGGTKRRKIDASFGGQGRRCCISYYFDAPGFTGTYSAYMTNGVTVAEAVVSGHYQTSGGSGIPAVVHVSSRNPGDIYTIAFYSTGAGLGAGSDLYKSSDGGASWARQTGKASGGFILGNDLHFPFHDNPGESIFFWTKLGADVSDQMLYRTIGASSASVSPTANDYGARWGRGIVTHPLDRNRMVVVGMKDASDIGVWLSKNGGITWRQIVADTPVGSAYSSANFAGDDLDLVYLWGFGKMGLYDDRTGQLYDKSGNIPTDFGTSMRFLNLCGKVT